MPPTLTPLDSFDRTDGAYPEASLIADASGNLFGTTTLGGANGDGTVFEITKIDGGYSSTPSLMGDFGNEKLLSAEIQSL